MTNREWLQTLSDEELAKYLIRRDCEMCIYDDLPICKDEKDCVYGCLQWLQQER